MTKTKKKKIKKKNLNLWLSLATTQFLIFTMALIYGHLSSNPSVIKVQSNMAERMLHDISEEIDEEEEKIRNAIGHRSHSLGNRSRHDDVRHITDQSIQRNDSDNSFTNTIRSYIESNNNKSISNQTTLIH